ncbi:unnamed protein product [Bemisia tabaci]|uniref:Cytochrome P450 n=1 Tax=Bemisia tabaci TaxID=7038 RepID=A0A9P0F4X9_BEMTA|nr:unnamed protein product [Bemisia tabaci]
MICFLLCIAAFCCILFRINQKSHIWLRKMRYVENFPGPPLKNRLIGHLKEAMVSPADLPTESYRHYKEYGGIYRFWLLGYAIIFIGEGKYAEIFFTSKTTEIKPDPYRLLHVWLGLGLLTSRGQLWQKRRKLLTPAFHFSNLTKFCDVFVKNTRTMVQQLHQTPDGSLVDVTTLMKLVALDNICETAMGIEINALKNPNHNYIRAVEDCTHMTMERFTKPWRWNDFQFFIMPYGRKYWKDLHTIFELTDKAINNRKIGRAERIQNSSQHLDEAEEPKKMAFLDLLLASCEDSSVTLSDEDLRDEVNTFMFEGHDTTAASMGFTLFLLGVHPEIQEKCYQELREIFQDSDRSPTMEDLQKMKYLEQVIKESMRMFPSVPILGREATDDVKLGDHMIPKKSVIVLNVYNLHRDPKVFPDPEKFNPDRFSPEESLGRHPFAYVPFAAGPRNCIGQKFAMLEEKVVLSYILRDFLLESEHGMDELQLSFAMVIRSQKNLNVRFTRRKKFHGFES